MAVILFLPRNSSVRVDSGLRFSMVCARKRGAGGGGRGDRQHELEYEDRQHRGAGAGPLPTRIRLAPSSSMVNRVMCSRLRMTLILLLARKSLVSFSSASRFAIFRMPLYEMSSVLRPMETRGHEESGAGQQRRARDGRPTDVRALSRDG